MSMTNNRKRKTATSSLIGITPPPSSELAYSNEELLLLDRMNRVSFDTSTNIRCPYSNV